MTKRSGFAVKIAAFIEADARDPKSIVLATEKISAMIGEMEQEGFICIADDSRFMLSKDIPEPASGAETAERTALQAVPGAGADEMPPIPADLDRRKR